MGNRTFLKYLAVFLGGASVLFSFTSLSAYGLIVKIFFIITLLISYVLSVKKFKFLVFLFYTAAIIAEFLTSLGFEKYYLWIISSFTICFTSGFLLLFPLLRKTFFEFKTINIIESLLVIIGLGYIILSVYFISIEELKDFSFFSIATISFALFLGACFYIVGFNTHSKKVLLFLTAVGYAITCILGLFNIFFFQSKLLELIVNISEVIAQFSFLYFMISYKMVLNNEDFI